MLSSAHLSRGSVSGKRERRQDKGARHSLVPNFRTSLLSSSRGGCRDAPAGRLPLGGPTSQKLRRGDACLAPAMLIAVRGEPRAGLRPARPRTGRSSQDVRLTGGLLKKSLHTTRRHSERSEESRFSSPFTTRDPSSAHACGRQARRTQDDT